MALNVTPVSAAYSGTRAYVLASGSGIELDQLSASIVLEASDAARAGLAGLDVGELVTFPALPDYSGWEELDAARQEIIPGLALSTPAERYIS